jgi:homoserine kinase
MQALRYHGSPTPRRTRVIITSKDGFPLPSDPAQNTAGAPLLAMLEELNGDSAPIGLRSLISKKIKPGSGIGSSAASAAGAVVAANHLLGNIFSKEDLVRFALFGEKVASGVKHADNIAPCIYGGITLIRSIFPLDIVAIPPRPCTSPSYTRRSKSAPPTPGRSCANRSCSKTPSANGAISPDWSPVS